MQNLTESQLRERLEQYSFYHTIQLSDSVSTSGWSVVVPVCGMIMRNLRGIDLKDKKVLDIGCRDGLFSFEAEKLGAREVIGIDSVPSIGARDFLVPFFQSKVQLREFNLLDLKPETFGKFDVVVFPGVLYHLRYPFWSLKLIRDVLKDDGVLLLETAVFVDENRVPLLYCPIGTESPYEATSCTFYNLKGLKDTLFSLGLTVEHFEYLNPESHSWALAEKAAKQDSQPVIDRAILTCRMTPKVIDKTVNDYWDGVNWVKTNHQ